MIDYPACMKGNTILKLPLHMTSATQSHNIYSPDTLAEIHNKYYRVRQEQTVFMH